MLSLIGSIARAVSSLGIVNTMVMSILERTREIGIMKAIGGSDDPVIVGSPARGKEFEPETPPYNSGMSVQQLRTLFGQTAGRNAAG